MDFEKQLREALTREPAPPDFAERVLARVPRGKLVAIPLWRRPLSWAIAAGLAVALMAPPAAIQYRRHRQEERALEARRQLLLALDITRVKLRESRAKILRATKHRL